MAAREGLPWPSPWGLLGGMLAVAAAQAAVIGYHHRRLRALGGGGRLATFWGDCRGHLVRPEGVLLLGVYLTTTWMLRLLPPSYYGWEGGLDVVRLFLQLAVNDLVQTLAHMGQHRVCPAVYRWSHRRHHRVVSPTLFDAFHGSPADTALMILGPLLVTAHLVHCNVWTYAAFGAVYSSWLTLLHSEVQHPWDPAFARAGLGTPGHHHVHHGCPRYNYGHLFMWWDMAAGTYRAPKPLGGGHAHGGA